MENARVSLDWQGVKQNGDPLWLLKNMGARLHLKGSHSNKMEATRTKQRRAYFNKVDSTKEFNPLRKEMRIPLEKGIVRRKKPEEQELEQKLSQLAALEEELAQCELELATLQAELHFFEKEFMRTVGNKYAKLDMVEALIAEYIASLNPDDQKAQEKARKYREAAQKSAEAANEGGFNQGITKDFKPSEELKKLYREAAKLIHPDLATDERERARRHHVMADVNQAYQDGDIERLKQILHQWECSPESVEGEDVGAELIRVIRKIAQATERLEEIKKQIETIENSDLYKLKTKVLIAKEQGRDILAEMAAEVDKQIMEVKKRYKNLCGAGGKKYAGRKR